MLMVVISPPENLPLLVCSEMGVNQPPNIIQGTEETLTLVSEDFVRGTTSVAGILLIVATPSSAVVLSKVVVVQLPV